MAFRSGLRVLLVDNMSNKVRWQLAQDAPREGFSVVEWAIAARLRLQQSL
jgi:hypothetical protein